MADPKFQVGQTVFAETGSRHEASLVEVQITALGRKWIGFGRDGRFDNETMVIDNGGIGYTRRAWLTREEHEERRARSGAWAVFRQVVDRRYATPDHLTVDQIRAMIAALSPQPSTPEEG